MWPRRTFCALTAGAGLSCAPSPDSPSAQSAAAVNDASPATSATLQQISATRREALAANPDALTAGELNAQIPEIGVIEINNSAGAAESREELRLLAWNMERGRRWKDGAALIRGHGGLRDPDVLFLGEMDFGMARSGNAHTTREMAAALGMNYAFAVEFLELNGGEAEERQLYPGENEWGYHGNAILSRYPLADVRLVRFPGIAKWYAHFQKRLGGRMALLATVNIGGQSVVLVCTHLESGQDKADADLREEEAKILAAEIEKYAAGKPVLFGGDLNTLAKSPPLLALEAAGLDFSAPNDYSLGTAQCEENGEIRLRTYHIDYLAVRGAEVVPGPASPAVILAALPAEPSGKLLGDHAIVTAAVRLAT